MTCAVQRCEMMVAAQLAIHHGYDSVKRSRSQRYQHKIACETLVRLVECKFEPGGIGSECFSMNQVRDWEWARPTYFL